MNNEHSHRFHIITGGPGSGKTSLIEALRARGFHCSVEAGRGVIQDQMKIDGRALPWCDPLLFAELMLSWEMRSYRQAELATGPVFFDRGVPDVAGYLRLMNIPVPQRLHNAIKEFSYDRTVFIAPPWPEIFRQDQERKQDLEEAQRTYNALVETYSSLGHDLVELPKLPIDARCEFILDHLRIKQFSATSAAFLGDLSG